MKEIFRQWANKMIQVYLQNEEKQILFPSSLILLFRIQQALLSLSYIYGKSNYLYIDLISMFARPQQYIPHSEVIQYIIFVMCIFYILQITQILPNNKIVIIFGQLLRTSALNFFFEISRGQIQVATHIFLVLVSLPEMLIVQGTLNAVTINFQHTRFTFFDFLIINLNYILMILYTYGFSENIVIILAIILNVLRIINQILYSSFKNLITKTILLTIKISTLIYCIFYVGDIQIQTSSLIVIFPLIFQVIHLYYSNQLKNLIYSSTQNKYCNIILILSLLENIKNISTIKLLKPKRARDRIIYSSFLMLQKLNYEAFLELNQIQDRQLNIIEIFKKSVIRQKCLNNMKLNISNNYKSDNVSITIQSMMNSEKANFMIQNDIIQLIKDKIECLQFLKHTQCRSYFNKYSKITDKLLKLQVKLENQYEEFPCEKTQGILGFFYGEIINDYISAHTLFSVVERKDQKIQKIIQNQDLFSNKMIYLMINYNGTLIIDRSSNESGDLLKIPNNMLSGLNLSKLIPSSIAKHHDNLVQQFLKTGYSKYFRNISQTYFQNESSQLINSIELLIEINFTQNLNFIAFLQPPAGDTLTLILNEEQQIQNLSESLIKEIGIGQVYKFLLNINIRKLMPAFPNEIKQNQIFENFEIFIEKQDEESQASSQPMVYLTNFKIEIGYLYDQQIYYIIHFEQFKRSPFYFCSNLSNQTPLIIPKTVSKLPNPDVNEECSVNIPYNDEIHMCCQYNSINQLDFPCLDYYSPTIKPIRGYQNETKFLSTLEYTNVKSPYKPNEKLLGEPKYFSKCQINSSSINFEIRDISRIKDIQSSQISNLFGARNSKYYKQFETVWKIKDQNGYTRNHKLFLFSIISCIIVQLIIQTIQITQLDINLKNLASDIDLLQIKNFVYQPLETFLLTRWTIYNYNLLKVDNNITDEEYNNLIVFPKSNLNQGYDQLNKNLKQVINRPVLQIFLENTYVKIYEYISTNQGEEYNLSLRNSMNILTNFQYSFKMAYQQDGNIVTDSPYVYFQYVNYLTIKKQFDQLNEIVLEQTINRSIQLEKQIQIIFLISISTVLIQFSISLIYFLSIIKRVMKNLNITQLVQQFYIELEIAHFYKIAENITKDQNVLFRYHFQLENKEVQFNIRNNKNTQKKRIIKKFSLINVYDFYYYLFLFFVISITFGNSILTYFEGKNYLNNYPITAIFYKAVSDVGTDVPTMFAQRDVLYSRKNIIPYFEDQKYADLLNEIKSCLNRTQHFIEQDYDFSKFIVSESFQTFFNKIQNTNICDYIPNELVSTSISLCNIVMNQNMQRGLQAILIYIINHITTDMEINQFVERTQASYLELEGAFLVSNVIKVINDEFYNDLMKATLSSMESINSHNFVALFTLFAIILFTLTFLKKKLIKKLHLAQRLIYLLPTRNIVLDQNLERAVRFLQQEI